MRPIRFFTGILTLSLLSSVVLGNSFHGQKNVAAQESHHHGEHVDSTETDEIASTLSADANEDECHEGTAQVAIASPAGQRLAQVDSMAAMPFVFMDGTTGRERCAQIFLGRTVPLFEYASLFARTISIRV